MTALPIDPPILPAPGKYIEASRRVEQITKHKKKKADTEGGGGAGAGGDGGAGEAKTFTQLTIVAACIERHGTCPHCGSKEVRPWNKSDLVFQDSPYRDKQVQIIVRAVRERCRSCGRTFTQPLPGMSQTRQMTERLVRYLAEEGARRPFTPIANEVGVAEATVRHVFNEFVATMEEKLHIKTPQWMAITDVGFPDRKVPRTIVVNAQAWTIVDLLESSSAASVEAYLGSLRNRETVQLVGIDLHETYPELIGRFLPGALVFVDKAHVLSAYTAAMLAAARRLRAQMTLYERRKLDDLGLLQIRAKNIPEEVRAAFEERLEKHPLLGNLYRGSEALHAVFEMSLQGRDAMAAVEGVFANLDPAVRSHFAVLESKVAELSAQVAAYFDHGGSRASMTAIGDFSDLGAAIDHAGQGRAFEALRAQLLYPKYFPAFTASIPGPGIARLCADYRAACARKKS